MKKLLLFIPLIFIMTSCTMEGKWKDNILLETKDVSFTAKADSIIIKTGGTGWWIDCIFFQDSTYKYYRRDDIDILSDSFLIHEKDFQVEKRDSKTLFIQVNKNTSGKTRYLSITLENGNYFDYITITQAEN